MLEVLLLVFINIINKHGQYSWCSGSTSFPTPELISITELATTWSISCCSSATVHHKTLDTSLSLPDPRGTKTDAPGLAIGHTKLTPSVFRDPEITAALAGACLCGGTRDKKDKFTWSRMSFNYTFISCILWGKIGLANAPCGLSSGKR